MKEKIDYYKKWLEGPFYNAGRVHVDALIAHHLKSAKRSPKDGYQIALRIACKISRAILYLEKRQLSIPNLTRKIWAAYKNLLKEPPETSFDVTTDFDRFIIKTQIDLLAIDATLPERLLRSKIYQHIQDIAKIPACRFENTVTLTASHLLAKSTPLFTAFTHAEQKSIIQFVRGQIALAKGKTNTCEVGRRLIALYPLTSRLPKTIPDDKLRAAIRYTYCLACGRTLPACPILDPSIYALLNAQVIALFGRIKTPTQAEVTDHLLKLFAQAKHLPHLQPYELGPILWLTLLEETHYTPSTALSPLIENTLSEVLIQTPTLSFEHAVQLATRALRAAKKTVDTFLSSSNDLDSHISIWSHQGDMVHRWMHLDPLQGQTASTLIEQFPNLKAFRSQIEKRQTIIQKYRWYRKQRPIDRFKSWHFKRLKSEYPKMRKTALMHELDAFVRRAIPLLAI